MKPVTKFFQVASCAMLLFLLLGFQGRVTAQESHSLYLPLVVKSEATSTYPAFGDMDKSLACEMQIGVEVWPRFPFPKLVRSARLDLIRRNYVRWALVEPQRGQYDLAALQQLDADLGALTGTGVDLILILFGSPEWAREGELEYMPIREKYLPDFAAFAAMIAERYPNVKYFEVWNEPDSTEGVTFHFGGWGEQARRYGRLLALSYDAIKTVRPDAQVLFGSLMFAPNVKQFVPQALAAGGKYDLMGFHHYSIWRNGEIAEPSMTAPQKVRWLRTVTDAPLWLTEVNLLCDADCGDDYEEARAAYLEKTFQSMEDNGVCAAIVYALVSKNSAWRNAALLWEGQETLPAWDVLLEFSGGYLPFPKSLFRRTPWLKIQ
jgi:hypothetical protein